MRAFRTLLMETLPAEEENGGQRRPPAVVVQRVRSKDMSVFPVSPVSLSSLSKILSRIETSTRRPLRWYHKFGQWLKLGSLLRRTDLDDEQTEAVFGRV